MRPTLFVIPTTFFGIPLLGMGILFWGILLSTAIYLAWRVYRRGFDSEANSGLIFGLIAAGVIWLIPQLVGSDGFPIRGYGFFLLLAIISAFGLFAFTARKFSLSLDERLSLIVWCVIFGLIGARLFYVLEYRESMIVTGANGIISLRATLWKILNLTEGGLVVYGSLFGGAAAAIFWIVKRKLPLLANCDAIIPAVVLGMAIGRLGCLMNGCCYGEICLPNHGITFPPMSPAHCEQLQRGEVDVSGLFFDFSRRADCSEVVILKSQQESIHAGEKLCAVEWEDRMLPIRSPYEAAEILCEASKYASMLEAEIQDANGITRREKLLLSAPRVLSVYPTQLYSAAMLLTICGILLCVPFLRIPFFSQRDGKVLDGAVLATFLLLEPPSRFVLEMFRADEKDFFSTGMTVSQNVSVILGVIGIALAIYIVRKSPNKTAID